MREFLRWVVFTVYPYAAIAVPVIVAFVIPALDAVSTALLFGFGVFGLAAWLDYRRWQQDDADYSAARSRARAGDLWPPEEVVRREGYALGVMRGDSRRRAHYVVFAPSLDERWYCVREPGRRGRIDVAAYPGYDAMILDLKARGIMCVPPSVYSRALVASLRESIQARGVWPETLAAGTHEIEHRNTLVIGGSLTVSGPRYAEFEGRVPNRSEAEQISQEGLGLSLIRVPKAHRGLEFLEWFPDLRGLFVSGKIDPARIGDLTELRHLSLIATGDGAIDFSRLAHLDLYEGDLRGRESVLALPLRQLYLERVAQGVLSQVPPTLEELSLEGAANLNSLQPIARARGLRELSIYGPRTLDIGAIAAFTELTSVTLTGIGALTGVSGLDGLRRLRELTLIGVGSIDDIGVLDRLTDRGVVVSADELEIRSR